jgi:WD40 repeat protein
VRSPQTVKSIDIPFRDLSCLAFAPNGDYLLAAGGGAAMFPVVNGSGNWRPESRKASSADGAFGLGEIIPIPSAGSRQVHAASFIAGTSRCLLAVRLGQTVRVWRESTCGVAAIASAKRGHRVVTAGGAPISSSDDTLRVWNDSDARVLSRFIGDCPMTSCAILPGETHVVVGDWQGRLHMFELLGCFSRPTTTPESI